MKATCALLDLLLPFSVAHVTIFSVRESNAVTEDGSNRTAPRVVVGSVTRAGQGAVSRPRLGATKGSTKGGAKGCTRGGDKVLVQGWRQGLEGLCMSVRCLCLHEIVCACIMLSVCVCKRLSVHV